MSKIDDEIKTIITYEEAAHVLSVAFSHMRRLAKQHNLTTRRVLGRVVLVRSEVEALLAQRV